MNAMKTIDLRSFGVGALAAVVVVGSVVGGSVADRLGKMEWLDKFLPRQNNTQSSSLNSQRVLSEENVVIEVAEKVSPSVVTVGIKKTQTVRFMDPFGMFRRIPGGQPQERKIEQDIGTGFVISADGLIVTNKHVVDDSDAEYKIVTRDDKTYEVEKIYRDPVSDLAILKISPSAGSGFKPVEMGDSAKLKVGQFVVAIGTALGEFRHTVTTGVVSGLGRGITAGSPFEGSEKLDDVIQTDAAINPGNSGGPLLNSAGQVIGVNVAVSTQGQNIGFALPINVVKEAIENFNKTGQFSRPYLGVRYRMIDLKTALNNDVVQGAYVQEVIEDSPAARGGIEPGDIITKMGGEKIDGDDQNGLAKLISGHKVGDRVELEVWREGETNKLTVTLEEAK
ncbi:hypothetical protein A2634_01475 [Candidatus Amesbacteria bacterium RIFCSPHIGHO2_01_FULL_48_32]|nr:MAG: hypothetical protein A2634_01475 [Candidatus Amesbacteria bacterium RIFCSPHIGHO2_01_FULL_48_32]HJZ05939.1 trypsin-like peptidase domain-containing protein [Patescibacteria group bacterium]